MMSLVRAGLESAAVNRLLGATSRRGAILAYHGVAPDGERCSSLHLTASGFREQLEALAAMGYHFISLTEMLARLRAKRTVARCVSITFDDAYAGLELALPALRLVRAPATVFVPTASIGRGEPFWWDRLDRICRAMGGERLAAFTRELGDRATRTTATCDHARTQVMSAGTGRLSPVMQDAFARAEGSEPYPDWLLPMTWEALRDWLRWEGATCAPHTVTHPVLPLLGEDEQRREITRSYETLRDEVDRVLRIVAYPFGLYDASTIRAASASDMTDGVTMDRVGCESGDDSPMRVPRLPFGGATPVRRMGLFLSAAWRWYRLREWRDGYPALPGASTRPRP